MKTIDDLKSLIPLPTNTTILCPFRNRIETWVDLIQLQSGQQSQKQIQDTQFPECYYTLCPFYNRDTHNCNRVDLLK